MTTGNSPIPIGWSKWGEWLTAVVAIGTAFGLAGAWMMQYQNAEGNARLIERVAYIVEDRSWLPPGVSPLEPLVGQHYFGDLAIVLGYGEALTPYIIPGMPAQYPPVAIFFFKLLGVFGAHTALIALVLLSVSLVPLAVWHLMRGVSVPQRLTSVVLLVALTMPMISALDRGGMQFVAFGLLALCMFAYARDRPVIAVALFVVAVSLKSYLLVFALYPLVRGHRSFAIKAIVTTVVVNGVLFLAFPGRPTVSFGGFLTSTVFYSTTDMVIDGNGLASIPLRFIEMTQGTDAAQEILSASSTLLTALGVFWLGIVVWLASRSSVPSWISMSLILASATMVVGAAYPYNYAWATIAAFYFGSTNSDPFPLRRSVERQSTLPTENPMIELRAPEGRSGLHGELTMRLLVLLMIAVSLVPQFWIWEGPSGDGRRAISTFPPVLVLLTTLAAGIFWLVNRKRHSTQYAVENL